MSKGVKLKSMVTRPNQQRPKRRRTKKLNRHLLEQLEFYFSEANLRHDHFMQDKVGEKGTCYVPMKLVLSFPLIQEMSVDEKNVINAIKESRMLELSEDKCFIRRKFSPPKPPQNLDQSTLYIENLPPDTTTEWLKSVCRKIGTVRHVSVPRYKKSDAVKGFAFVEFSNPEEVARACRIFQDPPNYFFPNRTEEYLRRVKRQKIRESSCFEFNIGTSPAHPQDRTADALLSGGSSCLNKLLESTFEIELVGNECGFPVTSSGQKRKRRQSQRTDKATEKFEEDFSPHTPAKKLKSLPAEKSSNVERSNSRDSEGRETPLEPGNGEGGNLDVDIKKSKRKVLFQISDIKKSISSLESSETHKSSEFLETCNKNHKTVSTSAGLAETKKNSAKIEQKFDNSNKGKNTDQNAAEVTSGAPEEAYEVSEKSAIPASPATPSALLNKKVQEVENRSKSTKRKRCISEPPLTFGSSKHQKYEVDNTGDDRQEEQTNSVTTLDIEAMIAQGRQQAKVSVQKKVIQSVVAMPKTKKMKKTRQKSRNARQRKKTKTRQAPPKLNVMPKVTWLEFKREYKKLQKQNMGKLKMTLKEGQNAGSVFIKKHLDVLKDVDISNESARSSEDERGKQTEEKGEADTKRGTPIFTPGVIASISALSNENDEGGRPVLPSIETIKTQLSKYGQGVAYVDTAPGKSCGFVRFHDGNSAQRAIMEEKSLALCLLTGESEEQYWDKLLACRAQKFARERRKIRGRTKILNRAEKCIDKAKRQHIRFDHDFVV